MAKKSKPEKWWRSRWSSAMPTECFMHKLDGAMIHVSQKEHGAVTTERLDDGFISYHPTREGALDHKRNLLERAISSTLKAGGYPAEYQKQLEELNNEGEDNDQRRN